MCCLNGYNHIEVTSENEVKAYIKVDYVKDTNTVILSLEQRIEALENATQTAESEA